MCQARCWHERYRCGQPPKTWRATSAVHCTHSTLELGPVVRIGPDELSFSDSDAAERIYGHDPRLVKAPVYNALGNGVVPSLFNGIVPHVHRERRKTLAPVFAKASVEREEHKITEALGQFVLFLYGHSENSLNMALWCRTLALEISVSVLLEEHLDLLSKDTPATRTSGTNVVTTDYFAWMPKVGECYLKFEKLSS